MIPAKVLTIFVMIFVVSGCRLGPDYHQKDGKWFYKDWEVSTDSPEKFEPLNERFARDEEAGYYRGEGITGSIGKSFTALGRYYAKDTAHVFYCDTYRESMDYFTTKHNRIIEIEDVDAPSFRLLDEEYGLDTFSAFYDGKKFEVKDRKTFQLLDGGFAKDNITGYYHQSVIDGSEGKTFNYIGSGYSRDNNLVFYSKLEPDWPEPKRLCFVLISADPSSFIFIADGYAQDKSAIYYKDKKIASNDSPLIVLRLGYAKNASTVFYEGQPVDSADASTFQMLETVVDAADAKDARRYYQSGKMKKKSG